MFIGIALSVTARLLGGGFSPAVLFALNEPGVWLDPSDLTTLFQDTAGTIPVTTPGQSVALALDKSKGLVLGSELITNGDFSAGTTGWTDASTAPATFTVVGAQGVLTGDGTNRARARQTLTTVAGRTYQIAFTAINSSGAGELNISGSSAGGTDILALSVTGNVSRVFVATSSTTFIQFGRLTAGTLTIDSVSVRELPGNHATQATAGSQPKYALLSANGVRNLANGSASVGDTTYWPAAPVQNGITATKVASGFDTDGLPYVDVRYQGTATDTFHATTYTAGNSQAAAAAGQSFTASLVTLFTSGSLAGVTGISVTAVEETAPSTFVGQTLGNAVTSSSATISTATRTISTGNQARLGVVMSFTSGATIDATFRIKGLQFELGSTRTAYQFNYARTNIAQPPYSQVGALLFDGVDDFLQTPSINFSATDKMTVFAGVRKLSDAAVGVVAELTVDSNSNPAFALFAPSGAAVAAYNFRSRGTLSAGATSATSFASPITNVLTGIGDISGDSSIIRVNGALSGNSASDQGTGNYSNAAIYIGRRAGTSLPFNGYLYSLIVRGAATTAADITASETWVNSRTGAY